MPQILINGYFLCRNLTGIERFAFELTKRLDELSAFEEISIIVPGDIVTLPPYKNLRIILHKKKEPHIWWQMVTLQLFLLTHREYIILEFANTILPFFPGIVFLHDIYCEFFPEDFRGLKNWLVRLYNKWQYRLIAKHAKRIITVSKFSRSQIADAYNIDSHNISVVYNGWEHFKNIVPDYSIFNEHPEFKARGYFFTLGSLSMRKNILWIIKYASKHPQTMFAVSGTSLPVLKVRELEDTTAPSNILLLGYLSDSKVKALMERCRAFLMPSYYEGFGIPPLEALSCGAEIIISNAASLPEIYGNTAHYIDPYNTDIDLEELMQNPIEKPDALLAKYSYDNSARQVYELLKEFR
ncbi:glycosyltransferase, family 1 [Treponema primitia ZAS-2]|uniref:Glycosyltransferase, family 1 n=1 Tax=Treponema primitia (strain ATCC BAA-887 / DSM 12427 / ZAS-2) TaxID=545694 RepID=F5YHI4_TREPZ|nr:glycosyltransferase family 1 protein [Treponema primitia]AEF85968.1 glycosyltransferase, family 1 [Treponema primitia ZAS-2]